MGRLRQIMWYTSLAIWIGAIALWFQYNASRPDQPRPELGRIYELNTHGHIVYITFKEGLLLYGLMAIGFGGGIIVVASRRA